MSGFYKLNLPGGSFGGNINLPGKNLPARLNLPLTFYVHMTINLNYWGYEKECRDFCAGYYRIGIGDVRLCCGARLYGLSSLLPRLLMVVNL
jgi:hypothetical protein